MLKLRFLLNRHRSKTVHNTKHNSQHTQHRSTNEANRNPNSNKRRKRKNPTSNRRGTNEHNNNDHVKAVAGAGNITKPTLHKRPNRRNNHQPNKSNISLGKSLQIVGSSVHKIP